MTTTPTESPEAATPPPGSGPAAKTANTAAKVPQGHRRLLTRRDRLTLGLMAGLPTILHVALVWVTALASI
ncbi:sugar ABC transporter permease, partial [Streptomyces sp. NPDC051773]